MPTALNLIQASRRMETMQNTSQSARSLWRSLIFAAMVLPALAWAQPVFMSQQAFTTRAVNLRAGPDNTFPFVAWVPAGSQVNVIGCINGWTWCDIQVGFNRGWAFGQFLSMPFQNQPIIIGNAGAWLGVPLIAFSVGPYWDNHYRNRPWWGSRNQWVSRPPPPAWGPPQGPNWRPPPGPGWRPPPNNGGRPPNSGNPGGGRPPNSGNPGGGRPPSSGNPGGGRPPSSGNPGGGRPPSSGNPGGGRPPNSGNPGGGRPSGDGSTTAPNSSQGPN
jgi:uncharacterized protein YraI